MAKQPKTFGSSQLSASHHPHSSKRTPAPPPPRRQAFTPYPGPSSSLLALLATVAASSSSVDGRPLADDSQPPDFLCPSLPLDSSVYVPQYHQHAKRGTSGSDDLDEIDYYLSPSPTRVRKLINRAGVPDKYVQGEDGRWRKERSWTLYGSTYCQCTDDSSSPTAYPEVDDQVNPTQITSTGTGVTTSPTPTQTDMTVGLPSGWRSSSSDDSDILTPIILILSLLLAAFIFVFILLCVAWRRKRRAFTQKDIEKKLRKERALDELSIAEKEELKRARSHQRMWAKASARWKENVRLSARRRRKHPSSTAGSIRGTDPHTSTLSLASQYSYTTPIPPTTEASESSPAFPTDEPSGTQTLASLVSPAGSRQEDNVANDPAAAASALSQPPEYVAQSPPTGKQPRLQPSAESSDAFSRDRVHSPSAETQSISGTDPPPGITPDDVVAHVATDDKTVLARMADLASAPPTDEGSSSARGSVPEVAGPSVPELDDEFEQLPPDAHVVSDDSPSGSKSDWGRRVPGIAFPEISTSLPVPTYTREESLHPPMFPAPPEKTKLTAPLFYEYPSTFEEDVVYTEPTAGPSAPPFEYGPSAPPSEGEVSLPGTEAVPCAPPLIDEEEALQLGMCDSHLSASAPPLPLEDEEPVASECATPISDQVPPSASSASPGPGTTSTTSTLRRAASPPDYLP